MWPPLWSSGQSSWLQIQRTGFNSRRCHIFWEVVGLERGPLSLVSTIEELLESKSSGSGLETRENGRRDTSRCPRDTLCAQKLILASVTSGGNSVGLSSQTQATEFVYIVWYEADRPKINMPKIYFVTVCSFVAATTILPIPCLKMGSGRKQQKQALRRSPNIHVKFLNIKKLDWKET
jgi:hypothetical protein